MTKPPRKPKRPNPTAVRKAVATFLEALGVDRSDPNLKETPERVAEAWLTEFVDGYQSTAQQALGEQYPAPTGSGMVVVTNLRFRSVCPHHLLPYEGRAHLAYQPKRAVVGFGRLSALLDCFAHRLVLQEELARNVARALAEELQSPATACILEAEQSCLRLRGENQHQAVTHAEAYEGLLATEGPLRRELWAKIGGKSGGKP